MININLIAERRARKLREMILMRWSIIGLGGLLLLMLGLNVTAWFDLQQAKENLNLKTSELSRLRQQRAELQETVQKINEKGPIVDLLDQVRISEEAWMTIFADISRIIPHEAYINNFASQSARDGVRLRFDGHALDENTVGVFIEALSQQTAWARPADLSSISADRNAQGQEDGVRFDFNVPVRGLLGGELK